VKQSYSQGVELSCRVYGMQKSKVIFQSKGEFFLFPKQKSDFEISQSKGDCFITSPFKNDF
jgi:hypothetical protein